MLSHAALYRKTKATLQLDESLKYRCARSMCVRVHAAHTPHGGTLYLFML